MTIHELMLLERGDLIRIRGSRKLFEVIEKAEAYTRNKGTRESSIKIKGVDETQPFEMKGNRIAHERFTGKPYVQKWPKQGV